MADEAGRTIIIGGGFTGLSAAHELAKAGRAVTILEADNSLGGLAGGFDVGGTSLEKFYHHWFTNDLFIMELIEEFGLSENVVQRPSRTGMYYAKSFFKLSSPLDVLRFTPLSFADRIRLGLLVLRARAVKDWMALENLTAREWLIQLAGKEVYRVVWEPLITGKFGPFANDLSAVWFWKKIALRGSTRSSGGQEALAYYKGGFAALADAIGDNLRRRGVDIRLGTRATGIKVEGSRVTAVETTGGSLPADAVLATPPLPLIADLLPPNVSKDFVEALRRVNYLANVCLVLELDRTLSDTYWLNVNDPTFPFVGVIEHTNFEPAETYGGRHIVYLSKYLPASDPLYRMSANELLDFAIPHVQRMFPKFDRSWVLAHHVWHADHAQPIVERHYSKIVPGIETPVENLFISTMAQVYPEDRGTNYAVREGRTAAQKILGRPAA